MTALSRPWRQSLSRRTILGGALLSATAAGTGVFALAESAAAAFSGYYRLTARHSGKDLAVQGASTADGAHVVQWSYSGSSINDEWQFAPIGSGFYRITARHSGKALAVQSASTSPGATIIQWTYGGSNTNDEWFPEDAGGGYFRLVNRHSGLVLDVSGGSTANGAGIVQWTRTTGSNQQFQITPVVGALPPGVYFQDTGTVEGWNNYPQTPQKQGVLRNVSSPAYKGSTAIEARQTYLNEGGGYHSETVQHGAQVVGTDYYYGQAIYLPANWQFHNQNVTFQQWSPENPSGPWELMYVQNDDIRFGGSGGISGTVGKIARGAWTRIVVRLKLAGGTSGAFEVWLNGVKTVSLTSRAVLPHTANSIRWSSGIYCTAWRDGLPAGQQVLSVFHDHARIAASYQLAEPANW
jgi:predicted nucleic acid-binding Zn ribbon protein